MAFILDKEVVQNTTPDSNGILTKFNARLPSAPYIGIAIGPASDHDIVRITYPGVDSLLFRGVMLPVPPSAQCQKVSIQVETVRPFSGRLQVIGILHPEEMSAIARFRAPLIQEAVISVPQNGSVEVEVFNGGRTTVNLTATIGGPLVALSPPINVATRGRIYRCDLSGATITEHPQFVEFPLNFPKWPTGLGDVRTFSWNEEEPEFDSIIYEFTDFGPSDDDIPLWYRAEARD